MTSQVRGTLGIFLPQQNFDRFLDNFDVILDPIQPNHKFQLMSLQSHHQLHQRTDDCENLKNSTEPCKSSAANDFLKSFQPLGEAVPTPYLLSNMVSV